MVRLRIIDSRLVLFFLTHIFLRWTREQSRESRSFQESQAFILPLRCCQIHLLLLACRLCLRADVSYFLCSKEIGDVCTQVAVDYEWSLFSLRDSSAFETRARVKSPHRVWPFSREVISRALAFRSLYYPWGKMWTTRGLLACYCLKGQGHCLGRSSIASLAYY